MSKIEWTEKTWNPVTGCREVSPGCQFCYARTMHNRLRAMGQAKYGEPFHTVRFHPAALEEPLRRRKPTTWFVNSMSDLFHPALDFWDIAAVFGVMAACPQHTFQVLTKRADIMRAWFHWIAGADGCPPLVNCNGAALCLEVATHPDGDGGPLHTRYCADPDGPWPLPNVWVGVSAENQATADERVPQLLQVPAAVRFVSAEPLLGPLELAHYMPQYCCNGDSCACRGGTTQPPPFVDWVIAGCESGPKARPAEADWFRSIRDQCVAAGVPFFLKQMMVDGRLVKIPKLDGKAWAEMPR